MTLIDPRYFMRDPEAQPFLSDYRVDHAAPDPATLMPPGPADQPVGPEARRRLRDDLALLEATADLPEGFPEQVPAVSPSASWSAFPAAMAVSAPAAVLRPWRSLRACGTAPTPRVLMATRAAHIATDRPPLRS